MQAVSVHWSLKQKKKITSVVYSHVPMCARDETDLVLTMLLATIISSSIIIHRPDVFVIIIVIKIFSCNFPCNTFACVPLRVCTSMATSWSIALRKGLVICDCKLDKHKCTMVHMEAKRALRMALKQISLRVFFLMHSDEMISMIW